MDSNRIDPFSLAEGTFTFELQGEIYESTDAFATLEGSIVNYIGESESEVIDGALTITKLVGFILVFLDEPMEGNYELDYCDLDLMNFPCARLGIFSIGSEFSDSFNNIPDDTFLNINFEEVGTMKGERVIGTFEAKVAGEDQPDERFDVVKGGFNVIIR